MKVNDNKVRANFRLMDGPIGWLVDPKGANPKPLNYENIEKLAREAIRKAMK